MNRLFKIFLTTGLLLSTFTSTSFAEDATSSINNHITAIEARFGIPVMYTGINPSTGIMRYDAVSPKHYPLLDRYLGLFEDEINKYPPDFFSRKRVKAIGLVERLFRETTPADGLYNPGAQIMMFDILRSQRNPAQQRHSIHHEIFHMMTFQMPGAAELDPQNWTALNAPGFAYGKQAMARAQVNPVNRFAPGQVGFVTDYAMYSIYEDQAEIFACLMQKNHHRLIMEWQEKDPYLARKIGMIKSFVQKYDSDMGEDYWRRLNHTP